MKAGKGAAVDASMAILAMWALFFVGGCYLFWLWCSPSEKG